MADGDRGLVAPRGLKARGKALWASLTVEGSSLRPDEVMILAEACRTADYIAALDAELKGKSLTATGSQGQIREHPLLSERRQQSAHLARLLHQLDVKDEAEESPAARIKREARSARGRHAANSRWLTA